MTRGIRSLFSHPLERWGITLWASVIVAAACAGLVEDTGIDQVLMAVRLSARTSAFLFCLAFSASALLTLWPNAFTRWQRRNRRYLGLAFVGSHLVHAACIWAYASLHPAAFHAYMNPTMYVLTGTGYALLAAMALTSFDGAQRAMGAKAWRALHLTGSYYLWAGFLNGFARHVADRTYWPLIAMVMLTVLARTAAYAKRRIGRPAGSGSAL